MESENAGLACVSSNRQGVFEKLNQKQCDEILNKLRSLSDPEAVKGMASFGINPKNIYGVSIPNLRLIAKQIGKDHELAQQLWASGMHEARILASMIDELELLTEQQLDKWAQDLDSWDVCDQCCNNLFSRATFAYQKAVEWSQKEQEFIKRAGFVLMATLAVHDREAGNEEFLRFLPIIKASAIDERNFVKKAVNWALRQIGKRNSSLNKASLKTAKDIKKMNSRSAKWVASDAIRELTSGAVQKRLRRKRNCAGRSRT